MPGKDAAVLLIDIGGTKTAFGLLKGVSRVKHPEFLLLSRCPTTPGKEKLVQLISSIYKTAEERCATLGCQLSSTLVVASPGKLIGPRRSIVSPGTGSQLDSFANEMANVDLSDLFGQGLPKPTQIHLLNDAIAQFRGGVLQLLEGTETQSQILGQKLAYIGPGTGLGGGFGEVDAEGKLTVYSDGHIHDLKVQGQRGQLCAAESLLSGRAFEARAEESPEHVINEMGIYLARIMMAIYRGDIEKMQSENSWSDADKRRVTGTSRFIMGGALGTIAPMNHQLIASAQRSLKPEGLAFEIMLIPNPETAALLGCFDDWAQKNYTLGYSDKGV